MRLQQVSESCFAVLDEKSHLCDANSGLVNLGGGVVVDTQSDLPHGRRVIELFGKVWRGMPRRVVNTHGDGDHVWGNQLFEGAEIEIRFERLGRCAAASPNRRASCRPAAGRCGRRCRDSMARSWRVGASRADVSFFKWRYQ